MESTLYVLAVVGFFLLAERNRFMDKQFDAVAVALLWPISVIAVLLSQLLKKLPDYRHVDVLKRVYVWSECAEGYVRAVFQR